MIDPFPVDTFIEQAATDDGGLGNSTAAEQPDVNNNGAPYSIEASNAAAGDHSRDTSPVARLIANAVPQCVRN